ncbi:NAD-dependent epimerase/dehydratase family protein [Paenibacillus puldeungensis]|uniref:NAD-dependent epimerase/dehydratase family protein n=1 Tax=Paenibacillus puldeungensis TaxID=696536 RepID=A0ABW3S132_9BACL
MKILVAGATGAIGQMLLPLLVQHGYDVIGMTRRQERKALIQAMGAIPVVADVFNQELIYALIKEIQPDVIIHQLTSLSSWDFGENSKIRKEGTRNLVAAAQAAGVKRMIAQSISWAYEPGDSPAAEEVPLDYQAPFPRKTTIDGVAALESAVSEIPDHVILRYGTLYGPGTWYDKNGALAQKVMNGDMHSSDGVTSFLHVEDAARAALQALEWDTGTVNIVDHEPAAGTEWLPIYAELLQAPVPEYRPGRNPGERGALNARAITDYGWKPLYPSWRSGFEYLKN